MLAWSAELPGFSYTDESNTFTLDLEGRKLVMETGTSTNQIPLPGVSTAFTDLDAIRFLDRNVPHPDIHQTVMLEYLRRLVEHLLKSRGFSLSLLDRAKFILRQAVEKHLEAGRQAARQRGCQSLLFAPEAKPALDIERAFHFDPNPLAYPAPSYDRGWKPKRHLYPHMAAFDTEEEKKCAMQIDTLSEVEVWVRNLDQKPLHAFWLPTYSGRFYPDFVARLIDGRILVVEYKGGHLISNDESKTKAMIGGLWEKIGQPKHLFLMATAKDQSGRDIRAQLMTKIAQTS